MKVENKMKIGIIGSGNVGSTLARHMSKLGHRVSIANSRGPETLATIASETGTDAERHFIKELPGSRLIMLGR